MVCFRRQLPRELEIRHTQVSKAPSHFRAYSGVRCLIAGAGLRLGVQECQ